MADYKIFSWFWPRITDSASAQKTSRQGYWACLFCAGATILLVIVNYLGTNFYNFTVTALFDVLLLIVIGWGIYKMNRLAAIAGLILYMLGRIQLWFEYGPKHLELVIIFALMFINSVRGTFAYHKYSNSKNESST